MPTVGGGDEPIGVRVPINTTTPKSTPQHNGNTQSTAGDDNSFHRAARIRSGKEGRGQAGEVPGIEEHPGGP